MASDGTDHPKSAAQPDVTAAPKFTADVQGDPGAWKAVAATTDKASTAMKSGEFADSNLLLAKMAGSGKFERGPYISPEPQLERSQRFAITPEEPRNPRPVDEKETLTPISEGGKVIGYENKKGDETTRVTRDAASGNTTFEVTGPKGSISTVYGPNRNRVSETTETTNADGAKTRYQTDYQQDGVTKKTERATQTYENSSVPMVERETTFDDRGAPQKRTEIHRALDGTKHEPIVTQGADIDTYAALSPTSERYESKSLDQLETVTDSKGNVTGVNLKNRDEHGSMTVGLTKGTKDSNFTFVPDETSHTQFDSQGRRLSNQYENRFDRVKSTTDYNPETGKITKQDKETRDFDGTKVENKVEVRTSADGERTTTITNSFDNSVEIIGEQNGKLSSAYTSPNEYRTEEREANGDTTTVITPRRADGALPGPNENPVGQTIIKKTAKGVSERHIDADGFRQEEWDTNNTLTASETYSKKQQMGIRHQWDDSSGMWKTIRTHGA